MSLSNSWFNDTRIQSPPKVFTEPQYPSISSPMGLFYKVLPFWLTQDNSPNYSNLVSRVKTTCFLSFSTWIQRQPVCKHRLQVHLSHGLEPPHFLWEGTPGLLSQILPVCYINKSNLKRQSASVASWVSNLEPLRMEVQVPPDVCSGSRC